MMQRDASCKTIIIKDSTLREGLDTPHVTFSGEQKVRIARLLSKANVPEIEIVAPSRVCEDLEFVKKMKEDDLRLTTTGLIYAYSARYQEEVEQASTSLSRFDILMPVSPKREPYDLDTKIRVLSEALTYSLRYHSEVGAGFPHATQTEVELLIAIAGEAVKSGAQRVTIYDTNGTSDSFVIYNAMQRLKQKVGVPIFFHGHNDLGLATANSLAAVYAGADGLDVTINGLGDRAGNTSLEQVVVGLHLQGFATGVTLNHLKLLSDLVEEVSGVAVSKLAPIIGEYTFSHKSPSHLASPELFEPFDPELVGSKRRLESE